MVFEECVLPLVTYGYQTCSVTVDLIYELRVTQRAVERSLLEMSLRDKRKIDVETVMLESSVVRRKMWSLGRVAVVWPSGKVNDSDLIKLIYRANEYDGKSAKVAPGKPMEITLMAQ
ncbi:hypothetical protein EVAR_30862_1 [Eumeta japonica]|uniref:Uncharacterized protein n=1 Tax=Eumeta variegata TaxID=151549 RepID=A0A4C1XS33_EUMVA|nr:hypothetical protein EVAR_30862_1 [Eumeta japonica]